MADHTVRVADDVAWTDLDDRVAVVRLDEPATDPLVLGGSAGAVWLAVADHGPATAEVVVEAVASSYDVEPAVVEGDVRALLDDAVRAGILLREPR